MDGNNPKKLLVLNGGNFLFPKPEDEEFGERPQLHNKFLDLLMRRRLLNIDIIITFPDPQSVPERLTYFVTDYIILPILSEYKVDEKNPSFLKLLVCIEEMNSYHTQHLLACLHKIDSYHKEAKYFYKEYLLLKATTGEIIASPSIDKEKIAIEI